jgi:hypothetical protein
MNTKTIRKLIAESMIPLLKNKKPQVAIEAGRLLLGTCPGIWVPENKEGEKTRANAELVVARQLVLKKIEHTQEVRKAANKRAWVRRRYKDNPEVMTAKLALLEKGGAFTAQQSALQSSRVDVLQEPKEPENELLENMLAALGEKSNGALNGQ